MIPTKTYSAAIALSIALSMLYSNLYADTVGLGYVNNGTPGSVTFWGSSYHPGVTFTEGSLKLEGVGSNPYASTTVTFDQLVTAKPAGLIDGQNNFYSASWNGCSSNPTTCGIRTWQGVSFSALRPGVYRYTYVPSPTPTNIWAPYADLMSGILDLTAAVLGTVGDAVLANQQLKAIREMASASIEVVKDRMKKMVGEAYYGTDVDNHLWIKPLHSWGRQRGDGGDDAGYRHRTNALVMGIDNRYDSDWWLGFAGMIGRTNITSHHPITADRVGTDTYQVSIYGRNRIDDDTDLNLIASIGRDVHQATRYDVYNAANAAASYNGHHTVLSAELIKKIQIDEQQTIMPVISAEHIKAAVSSYKDSLNTAVSSQNAQSVVVSVGANYSYQTSEKSKFNMGASVGRDLLARELGLSLVMNDGNQYPHAATGSAKNIFKSQLGYEVSLDKNVDASLKYNFYKRGGFTDNVASFTVKIYF